MTYLEQLGNSRKKYQVIFTEFVHSVRNKENYLFCFFEGYDTTYYVPIIRGFTENYETFDCKGKKVVLEFHEFIKSKIEYQKYKKAFFIDRDFDEPISIQQPPIYETPCYSIENFYVSDAVFAKILKNEFSISENNQEFETCVEIYKRNQKQFHKATLLFNAWYACLKDKRNNEGIEMNLNLDDKLPYGFVEITLEKVEKKYDYTKLISDFDKAPSITEEELNLKIAEFENSNKICAFRGKYEMSFLLKMIQLLIEDSKPKGKNNVLSKKVKFTFEGLNNDQAINVFSAYAIIPQSLLEYLKTVV